MKTTERLKLSWWHTFEHYQISLFGLFLLGLSIYRDFLFYLKGRYTIYQLIDTLSFGHLSVLVILGLYTLLQYKRLEFSIVKGHFTDDEMNEALDRTAISIWPHNTLCNYGKFLVADGELTRFEVEDELITILRFNDRILINSTTDLSNPKPNYFLYGTDAKNVSTFRKFLLEVKKGLPPPIFIEKNENIWSLKNNLIRIIAYTTFLTPIYFAYMIPEAAPMLVISVLCFYYIYLDAKSIIEQWKRKSG